jgi:glycosyltransferase involved in cell wall biosynthesis
VRILYHHRTLAEDGQAVHIRAMIRAFELAGHMVSEVGLVRRTDGRAAAPGRSRWSLVARAPHFARELAEFAYTPFAREALLRRAAGFDPELLYERLAFGNAGGAQAARRLGIPHVLEVNAPIADELERTRGLAFPKLARRLEEHVLRSATLVCAVSGVLAEELRARGVAPARLLVTPNGVDLERYASPDRAAARRALGLAGDGAHELVLGFVGYFRAWHRLELVLDALAEPGLEQARLVVVGEGPVRAALEARARALGLGERFVLAGPRPHGEVPELLAAFDLALVPAINPYASPLKLHEYMAASRAVIACDQPNLREVLTHGENGWLVPAGDARALAAAIRALGGDPALRARLGAAARRTVEERDLTWDGNVRRVLAALPTTAGATR